jgi:hypothetical protein
MANMEHVIQNEKKHRINNLQSEWIWAQPHLQSSVASVTVQKRHLPSRIGENLLARNGRI